jgi:short-subunit dehydrogenase
MNDFQSARSARPPTPLCLVTGAATGLGFALARVFAEAGCDLVLAGGDDVDLMLAAEELSFGGATVAVQCIGVDLSLPSGAAALHRKLRLLERPIDIFVANASVGAWGDFGSSSSPSDELAIVQSNTMTLLQIVRLVGKDMSQRGYGQIILASSTTSEACVFVPVQDATRAFTVSLAEGLARGLEKGGVQISSLSPEIEADGASARLKDPESVLAVARAAIVQHATARRLAALAKASPPARPPMTPPVFGRIPCFFGGSTEMPTA